MDELGEKIAIATLGKTVGLKGEMKIHLDTDFPEQFKPKTTFSTNRGLLTVKRYDPIRGLISFEGYQNSTEAAKLVNQTLYTTLEESRKHCNIEDGELFWFDVIGMKVFQQGELLGEVTHIERMAGTDMVIVSTDPSLVKQGLAKTFLIPYNDRYIVDAQVDACLLNVQNAKEILEAS